MRIAIFTDESKQSLFAGIIEQLEEKSDCTFYYSYDDFIYGLPESNCEAVIIAREGAEGMESARAAKILLPKKPLIWFTDDKGFGPESYRVGCTYFSTKPITKLLFETAIRQATAKGDDKS